MFLAAFLYYAVRFVIFGAVIVGGVFAGMKLRQRKDQKQA